ncbi:MAG TPA: serine hydrolase [Candidatus Kapabacteria bacterium]
MRVYYLLLLAFITLSASAQVRNDNPIWLKNSAKLTPPQPIRISFPASSGARILAIDTTLPTRIQNVMNALYAATKPHRRHGVSASVIVPGLPQWSGSVGQSHEGVPMHDSLLFEIASNTKTFTTAIILQMVDEGILSLSDPIKKFIGPYPNVDTNITIEQMLNHSSGIYDYLNDDPTLAVLNETYLNNADKVMSPDTILFKYVGPKNFNAGTSYKYCNTNFLLLGLIAEKITGKSFGHLVHKQFITPLGLNHTFIGWEDSIKGTFAHNWIGDNDTVDEHYDIGDLVKTGQLSMAHAAGGIVSRPSDLVKWVKWLYEADAISPTLRAKMIDYHTWKDGSRYGLGTAVVPFNMYGQRDLYGHTGGLPGFGSYMFNIPGDSVSFVMYMNADQAKGDILLNDYAIAVLAEIYKPATSVSKRDAFTSSVMIVPNPVSTTATIIYELPEESYVTISIVNTLGEEVMNIPTSHHSIGKQYETLDLTKLPIGAYYYRIKAGSNFTSGLVQVVR